MTSTTPAAPVLFDAPVPQQVQDWLAERQERRQDRFDEVWEGVYRVAPNERLRNGRLAASLVARLAPLAPARGLVVVGPFNLGSGQTDFRVPDLGVVRRDVDWDDDLYVPTAELVVEVLSPADRTWAKLGHYAAHDVREVWVVDPPARQVLMHVLAAPGEGVPPAGADYRAVTRSPLFDLPAGDVGLDWP